MTHSQTQRQAVSSHEAIARSHRRFIIINGDDFGFSSGVNRAIIKAHEQGVLTSTSLMVTGQAFEEAVGLAKAHPHLAVGLHLVLAKGKAVLPPSQIPHLVDEKGNFSNAPSRAGLHYQLNAEARQELRLEIRAQLEKFCETGLRLSHVDGHLHLHSHPVVMSALVELADEFKIEVIRLPSEELRLTLNLDRSDLQSKLLWSFVFGRLRRYGERLLRSKGIGFVDRVYGLLQTGRMTETYLVGLIPQIRANLIEIYSHPAIAILGEPKPDSLAAEEFEALLSDRVRETLAKSGFELTNYNNPEVIAACREF